MIKQKQTHENKNTRMEYVKKLDYSIILNIDLLFLFTDYKYFFPIHY